MTREQAQVLDWMLHFTTHCQCNGSAGMFAVDEVLKLGKPVEELTLKEFSEAIERGYEVYRQKWNELNGGAS